MYQGARGRAPSHVTDTMTPAESGLGTARSSTTTPTPYLDARRAARRRELPPAGRRPARRPRCTTRSRPTRTRPCSRRWPGPGCRFDVASPAEITAAVLAGARAERPRLLQPGEAPRGRAVRGPARRRPVRRRLPHRGRRRSPRRHPAPASSAAWSPPARARTGRCRASTAARPRRRSTVLRQAAGPGPAGRRRLLPRRLPAARPGGVGGADRLGRDRLRARSATTASTRGCSTSAAASRRRSTTAARRPRRTAPPSSGTSPPSFGDHRPDHHRRARSRDRRATPASWSPASSAVVHRAGTRWVFLDAGVFTGLVETLDEAIRYPLATDARRRPDRPVRPRRPDLRQRRRALRADDGRAAAGPGRGRPGRGSAAPASTPRRYSTVGFNGFAPLATVVRAMSRPRAGSLDVATPAPRSPPGCPGRCCSSSSGTSTAPARTARGSSAWPARPGWRRTSCSRGRSARSATTSGATG